MADPRAEHPDPVVTEEEKRLVLELLPAALNESGIALALAAPSRGVVARAAAVLAALESEGRVIHPYPEVWRVAPPA